MKNQTNRVLTITILLILSIISSRCERDWTNPLDPESGIDWAPTYLSASHYSRNEVLLKWGTNYRKVDAYVLDKKINDGPWIENYTEVPPENIEFIDDSINTQVNNYSYQVYARIGNFISSKQSVNHSFNCGVDSLVDSRDGHQYSTIQTGNQCWMAENLKYLPELFKPDQSWSDLARYFIYDTTEIESEMMKNFNTYGVLYNWAAAENACPEGWTLPDFEFLIKNSHQEHFAGAYLKEKDTVHWHYPNTGATEDIGFSALPGGCLNDSMEFQYLKYRSYFWDAVGSYYVMYYDSTTINKFENPGYQAFSVRCVRETLILD